MSFQKVGAEEEDPVVQKMTLIRSVAMTMDHVGKEKEIVTRIAIALVTLFVEVTIVHLEVMSMTVAKKVKTILKMVKMVTTIVRRSTRMQAKQGSECSEFRKNHNPNARAACAPGARSTPITTY